MEEVFDYRFWLKERERQIEISDMKGAGEVQVKDVFGTWPPNYPWMLGKSENIGMCAALRNKKYGEVIAEFSGDLLYTRF